MTFFKLSLRNMKKSFRDYTVYFITLIFGICIFYVFNSIEGQSAVLRLSESKQTMIASLMQLLSMVSVFVSFVLGYLIVYSNNFLIRRRKKEFGLYQTMGLGKGKIGWLLFLETVIIGIISLLAGLFIGVFVSQGLSVVIADMFEADLSNYTFSFSGEAILKTCIYFGIIYTIVMIFNIVTMFRYKMIDLLNASKKNEAIKIKNPLLTLFLFLLSVILIGYAYYLLIVREALFMMGTETVIMLIAGAVGTYLFFSSLAGFLLKMVQTSKKLYFKNLNVFVLRQINNKINTTTVSITVISLMLLLTIGIMSSSLALMSAFNTDIAKNNPADISFVNFFKNEENDGVPILETFREQGVMVEENYQEIVEFTKYRVEQEKTYLKLFLGEKYYEELEKSTKLESIEKKYIKAMKESDYNALMRLHGKEEIVLREDEYFLIANFEQVKDTYNKALKEKRTITVSGNRLSPKFDQCIENALSNSNMNIEEGTFVFQDKYFDDSFKWDETILTANYKEEFTKEEIEVLEDHVSKELHRFYEENPNRIKPYDYSYSETLIRISGAGLNAMITFIGVYLGIIFSITSAAILAIGQLSESSDNKERYEILRKIGADDKMINRSLFIQIGIYFMLPLAVALIHSFVGVGEIARLISLAANLELSSSIFITAVFLIIIYGGYFFATYFGSKKIIKE